MGKENEDRDDLWSVEHYFFLPRIPSSSFSDNALICFGKNHLFPTLSHVGWVELIPHSASRVSV